MTTHKKLNIETRDVVDLSQFGSASVDTVRAVTRADRQINLTIEDLLHEAAILDYTGYWQVVSDILSGNIHCIANRSEDDTNRDIGLASDGERRSESADSSQSAQAFHAQ